MKHDTTSTAVLVAEAAEAANPRAKRGITRRDQGACRAAQLVNRSTPGGSAARQHARTRMIDASERREKAADILADGLVKLFKRQSEAEYNGEPTGDDNNTDSKARHLDLVRGEPAEGRQ